MNKELAQIYGNNPDSDDAIQKQAAAELAEKLAEEGALDLKDLSVEQLEELAASVMEPVKPVEEVKPEEKPAAEKTAETGKEEPKTEEISDEDKKKLAEADYLGRVMAHSFWQESREISKQAASQEKTAAVGEKLKALAGKAKGFAAANPKKTVGAAAGAAGFAAGRMSKKSSATPALDALAAARAQEILEANGIKPEAKVEEKPATEEKPAEKTAADDQEQKDLALANAVEEKAIALLKEQGYEIVAEEPEGEQATK